MTTSADATTKTLTILAEPPPSGARAEPPGGDAVGAFLQDDGNNAIESIVAKFEPANRARRPAHVLLRASTVRAIGLAARAAVRREGARFDVLQIVGHGMPGHLSLGSYWNRRYDDGENFYALDSNPHSYGVLRSLVADVGARHVQLLGCAVGSSESGGLAANGPTLLFALGQLWKDCQPAVTVWAADGIVSCDDFDEAGNFTGSLVSLERPVALTRHPAGAVFATPRTGTRGASKGATDGVALIGPATRFFKSSTEAQLVARSSRGAETNVAAPASSGDGAPSAASSAASAASHGLTNAFDREATLVKPCLPLALPLCYLSVECDGEEASAELLLLDTYYVRVRQAGRKDRYFGLNPEVNKARVAAFVAGKPGAGGAGP